MIDIEFDNVSKRYRIARAEESESRKRPLMRGLNGFWQAPREFWALREVSFQVRRNEVLGIIGNNGAGKSTVLKLLSSITMPSSGEITINGRLSALIEMGSGFHPELTGRENIYLSGSILGMRRREIARNLDSIIDFAGVSQFIDTPVKRYSSGMYVRLGFSIAAHLHPDILLLDEVLAVGDTAFQGKCLRRIAELKDNGTTIVFISHDMTSVERLCDRVLLLDHGRIISEGGPANVIEQYRHSYGDSQSFQVDGDQTGAVTITGVMLQDGRGRPSSVFNTGAPISVSVEYRSREYLRDLVFEVFYYSANGEFHCQYTTEVNGHQIDLDPGTGFVEFYSDEFGLQPGFYYLDATLKYRGAPDVEALSWRQHCATFQVDPGKVVLGKFYSPHQWRLQRHSVPAAQAGQ